MNAEDTAAEHAGATERAATPEETAEVACAATDLPADGPAPAPAASPEPEVPVLRDVVQPAAAARPVTRRLDRDARAALAAEAVFLLDEVLDECLPELEARLRERLEQRLAEWLDEAPGRAPRA